jgi:hypothetical protein
LIVLDDTKSLVKLIIAATRPSDCIGTFSEDA